MTHADCCGTTRTPSITNTAAVARTKNGTAKGRSDSTLAMKMVAMMTPMIFKAMLPPAEIEMPSPFGPDLRWTRFRNCEGVAIDCTDIEDFARIAGHFARNSGFPLGVTILHARAVVTSINP
jgi:hypothetical protein